MEDFLSKMLWGVTGKLGLLILGSIEKMFSFILIDLPVLYTELFYQEMGLLSYAIIALTSLLIIFLVLIFWWKIYIKKSEELKQPADTTAKWIIWAFFSVGAMFVISPIIMDLIARATASFSNFFSVGGTAVTESIYQMMLPVGTNISGLESGYVWVEGMSFAGSAGTLVISIMVSVSMGLLLLGVLVRAFVLLFLNVIYPLAAFGSISNNGASLKQWWHLFASKVAEGFAYTIGLVIYAFILKWAMTIAGGYGNSVEQIIIFGLITVGAYMFAAQVGPLLIQIMGGESKAMADGIRTGNALKGVSMIASGGVAAGLMAIKAANDLGINATEQAMGTKSDGPTNMSNQSNNKSSKKSKSSSFLSRAKQNSRNSRGKTNMAAFGIAAGIGATVGIAKTIRHPFKAAMSAGSMGKKIGGTAKKGAKYGKKATVNLGSDMIGGAKTIGGAPKSMLSKAKKFKKSKRRNNSL